MFSLYTTKRSHNSFYVLCFLAGPGSSSVRPMSVRSIIRMYAEIISILKPWCGCFASSGKGAFTKVSYRSFPHRPHRCLLVAGNTISLQKSDLVNPQLSCFNFTLHSASENTVAIQGVPNTRGSGECSHCNNYIIPVFGQHEDNSSTLCLTART